MTCLQFEIRLCEYLDGTLPAAERAELERHMQSCGACAAMARDAGAAVDFTQRVADIAVPPQLLGRIFDETRTGRHGRLGVRGLGGWLHDSLGPFLQPRLVMGMAMTILSFSMMARCAGISPRQLRPSDLNPVNIWASIDDRAHRAWMRTEKFYDSIKFVYQVQTQLREWTEQQEEEERQNAAQRPLEERRLPTSAPGRLPQKETPR